MRSFITTITMVALTSLLVACNTMEGFGEDIQAGGAGIERAAE